MPDTLGGDIVVVSHATPIRALVGAARGWALPAHRRIRVHHAGIRVVRAGPRTLERWAVFASSTSVPHAAGRPRRAPSHPSQVPG